MEVEFDMAALGTDVVDDGIINGFKVRFSDSKGRDVTAGFRTQ